MGQQESVFSAQELDDYQDLTFFTKREVIVCFTKFKALAPDEVGQNKDVRLPMEIILSYPELRVNPFGDRICLVFSSSKDGDCTFEDFLDMMSVFSEDAPISVKAEYAFRIFDFDGDDMLGPEDMEEIIRRLLGDESLPPSEITQLVQNLTAEADLDDDGMLSFAEFEHVVAKSTDFEHFQDETITSSTLPNRNSNSTLKLQFITDLNWETEETAESVRSSPTSTKIDL